MSKLSSGVRKASIAGALFTVAILIVSFALVALFLLKADGWRLGAISLLLAAITSIPVTRRLLVAGVDIVRGHPRTGAISAFAGAVLLPLFLGNDGYWIHVFSIAMIFAIMAIGLNVHLGEVGLVNLGYAGLFAVGAYTATLLTQAGVSFWIATPAAMAMCWLVGGLLGACSIRTSGDYFALVTLGFGLIVQQLIISWKWLTSGNDGITNIGSVHIFGHSTKSPIELGFITLVPQANFYYLCLVALAGSALVATRYQNAWVGRMWTSLRQDPIGVACFGLNVPIFKVQTVAFGSMFAGLAGSLFAHQIGFISPDDFSLLHSVEVLAAVILGGLGSIAGAILGGVILYVSPEKLRFLGDYRLLMYGGLLVLLLIYSPRGLLPDPRRRYERF